MAAGLCGRNGASAVDPAVEGGWCVIARAPTPSRSITGGTVLTVPINLEVHMSISVTQQHAHVSTNSCRLL